MRARTQATNQMGALIGSADERLRAELRPLPAHTRIHTCAAFNATVDPDEPIGATRHALGVLARRWLQLDIEITALDDQLTQAVPVAAPTLLDVNGVGIDTAGALLVAAGDNPERIALRSRVRRPLRCQPRPRVIRQDHPPPT